MTYPFYLSRVSGRPGSIVKCVCAHFKCSYSSCFIYTILTQAFISLNRILLIDLFVTTRLNYVTCFNSKHYYAHFLKVHSHLRFIRRELLCKLFSPRNRKTWVPNPLLNFSVYAKVDQITSLNAFTSYSTSHYLVNSSGHSSRLINHKCQWILNEKRVKFLLE